MPYVVEKGVAVVQHPDDRKGLSESVIRKRLEKRGWEVWRGGYLHAPRKPDVYPNVRRRYEELYDIVDDLAFLQYVCVVHHGMPDLFCYKAGTVKFVECKLGYETLSHRQKDCCKLLLDHGYQVELHRVVEPQTKRRRVQYDLDSGEKLIEEKQLDIASFA